MSTLHGIWQPIRAELDGESAPSLALERMELSIQADAYTVRFAGTIHDRGTLIQSTSTLLLTAHHGPNAGRIIPAIYQLVGDRLRICYGIDGTAPTVFETTSGSRRYLVTYRRQAGA